MDTEECPRPWGGRHRRGLEIAERLEDVEIVLTATSTHLTGVVTDPAGQLVPDASVIVFPEARERRSGPLNRFVISARADATGAFTVSGLPPGRYFAVAVAVLAEGEWAEPAHLDSLGVRSVQLTLLEGESKRLGLRVGGQ